MFRTGWRGCWAVGVAVLAGCVPSVEGVDHVDHAQVVATRVDVVEDGPEAPDWWEVPEDRHRSTPLPGDEIRLTATLGGEDGPLDAQAVAPIWLQCKSHFCPLGAEDVGCDQLDYGVPCLLAEGSPGVGRLAGLDRLDGDHRSARILMISGTPGGPSSRECRERLRDPSKDQPLWDCIVASIQIDFGPEWWLIETEEKRKELPDPLLADIPDELKDVEPNLNPEVNAFHAGPLDSLVIVPPGGSITVTAGDRIDVGVDVDERDAQAYTDLGVVDEMLESEERVELVRVAWRWDTPLPDAIRNGNQLRFTVPDDTEGFTLYATVHDDRHSEVGAWIHVDVDR